MQAAGDTAEQSVEAPQLLVWLRQETQAAHRSLERSLDLLRPPLQRSRFVHVLQRFLSFHLAWEAALARHPVLAAFQAPRSRLSHLRADLKRLGADGVVPDVGREPELGATLASCAHALGSLYVLEGSTLGGRHISRALAAAAWSPPGGLTYFDPYGERTGAMWREFKSWCEGEARGRNPHHVAQGATMTFSILEGWLVP